MIKQYFQELLDTRTYTPGLRDIDPAFLLDEKARKNYKRAGYAVIKHAVPQFAIDIIEATYREIQQMPGFYEGGSFLSSPQYGKVIQQYIQERLTSAVDLVLPGLTDSSKCVTNFFNLLVLKFSHENKALFPHQDISFIDEAEATGAFLWIPTETIDEKNGALYVLPGSHQWAAWQRIHDQYDAPYHAHRDLLLPLMKPVYLEKGDLIVLDSAIIHASAPNISGKLRIAMNTSIIPTGVDMVHYNLAGVPKGMIRKFRIDPDFCKDVHYIIPDRVPERYQPGVLEKLRYNGKISKRNLMQILETWHQN